jgi:hypothetical protein
MQNQPLRLRPKPVNDDYPSDRCAVVRCTAIPMVDDDSRKFWDYKVPLCEQHWIMRSKDRPSECALAG